MISTAQSLVTWAEFLRLPERPEVGKRYELHDGEVVVVPPARPLHIKVQKRLERLLEAAAGARGVVVVEFPYRPVPNLQYWVADVAYVPQPDWDALPPNDYPVYAPPLVIEVLSPSNTPAKIDRQRIAAMSAGTQEFWLADAETRTVHVTAVSGAKTYKQGEFIPITLFTGAISVDEIFG